MIHPYNLYNLEAPFRNYLTAVIPQSQNHKALTNVSIKNYLSDIRHFFGWFNNEYPQHSASSSADFCDSLTTSTIEAYKTYLVESNLPIKTVNRRLSTLRKFCSFCISQGWMKENVAKRVGNVGSMSLRGGGTTTKQSVSIDGERSPRSLTLPRDDKLTQFQSDTNAENDTLADLDEFFTIINS